MASRTRLIDVSHTIENGMVTYKGLPAPIVCDWLTREASRGRYAPGYEFHIGKIEMVGNTGTYIDSPFHRYEDGKHIADLPLESVAQLECLVVRVDISRGIAIDEVPLPTSSVGGRAILFHTGWDKHWRNDAYYTGNPHLTARAAGWLVQAGAALVGIDSLNIDGTHNGERPVHTTLLGNEIPIVEHLRGLEHVPEQGGCFSAVPAKVKSIGTWPVRAYVSVAR